MLIDVAPAVPAFFAVVVAVVAVALRRLKPVLDSTAAGPAAAKTAKARTAKIMARIEDMVS